MIEVAPPITTSVSCSAFSRAQARMDSSVDASVMGQLLAAHWLGLFLAGDGISRHCAWRSLAQLAGLSAPWLSDPSLGRLQIGYYLWQFSLLPFSWGAVAMLRMEPEPLSSSRKKVAGEPLDQ